MPTGALTGRCRSQTHRTWGPGRPQGPGEELVRGLAILRLQSNSKQRSRFHTGDRAWWQPGPSLRCDGNCPSYPRSNPQSPSPQSNPETEKTGQESQVTSPQLLT